VQQQRGDGGRGRQPGGRTQIRRAHERPDLTGDVAAEAGEQLHAREVEEVDRVAHAPEQQLPDARAPEEARDLERDREREQRGVDRPAVRAQRLQVARDHEAQEDEGGGDEQPAGDPAPPERGAAALHQGVATAGSPRRRSALTLIAIA
jgi:hypothetical protein